MMKFYDITHRGHLICNPTSVDKLSHLVGLLRLPAGAQVVDIACGKGEFLIRLVKAYGVRGTGIDISPFQLADARSRLEARAPRAGVFFDQMNGADYKPDEPHSMDLASCIGASWIFGGHAQTLAALIGMVRPGGWVIVGEPYWRKQPPKDYLEALECASEDFGSHSANAEAGERLGMELVHTIASSQDDWDIYEGLQWLAADEYARTHHDDPDLREVGERVNRGKAAYLRWGRDTLGWAIYVFRAPSVV